MRRHVVRAVRVIALAAMLSGSALVGWVEPAGAAASLQGQGWWWRLQPGGTPVPLPNPNVPDNGLLVEGAPDDPSTPDPDGASAIAAVRFTLDQGQANPVLTLKIVKDKSQAGPSPIILACQAGSQWNPGAAQPWATHPKPDCAKPVQGQVAPDGSTVVFAVGALQFNNELNLIIVPGVDPSIPGANSSIFSLVFEGPTNTSLTTTAGSAPSQSLPPTTSPSVPTGLDSSPAPSAVTSVSPSAGYSAPVAALPPSQQGSTPSAPAATATAPSPTIPLSSSPGGDDNNSRLIGLLVLLAGLAAALWSSRSAVTAFVNGTEGEQVGGLGRFARPREGVAPRLT